MVDELEQLSLLSVGIDIGTSTSHVVFSLLVARRRGADLSGQFEVAERALVHAAPIILTPYRDATTIDQEALTGYIEESYRNAELSPSDVDTGALVITGEALNRDNAQAIAERFAAGSGRFVCVSAGPQHEALLAAHGSGAVAFSAEDGTAVMNIDIGGGTTKVAVIRSGRVVQTAALTVGARLIAFDDDGRMIRIEPAAHLLAELLDLQLRLGDRLPAAARDQLVELMTSLIFEVVTGRPSRGRVAMVLLTEPVPAQDAISSMDAVVMSGGVAEYLSDPSSTGHGDLGLALATRVRDRLTEEGLDHLVRQPVQAARATVFGAAQHSLATSGITSYVSDPGQLPVYGLQAIKVAITDGTDMKLAVWDALRRVDRDGYGAGLVLALTFASAPGYRALRQTAEAIAEIATGPLYVVMDVDRGRALGRLLERELRYPDPVVSIDGVHVGELDFLDIGAPLGSAGPVPVTIKSLVFSADDNSNSMVRR